MVEHHHLQHLTHLNFIKCEFPKEDKTIIDNILNHIWSLPKLLHCHIDIYFPYGYGYSFLIPSVISSSIEYLYIRHLYCELSDLRRLFQYTPRLQRFYASIYSDIVDEMILSPVTSITVLYIQLGESTTAVIDLLRNLPNVHHLRIDSYDLIINGHVWENLITKHLPMLKIFRMVMSFNFPEDDNKERRIDELLDSFRTSFWLQERQWFVRCDWDRCPECDYKTIHLYTLTYSNYFNTHCQSGLRSKSTCLNDSDTWLCKQMPKLTYINNSSSSINSPKRCFSNIRRLDIIVPVDDNFWSSIQNFDQLTSLSVTFDDEDCDDYTKLDQAQVILDQAPRLISLGFELTALPAKQLLPIKYISKSIRRLYLQEMDYFFDDQQCALLSQSSLGIQCEILVIRVKNRTNVIDLVNSMINLQVLNVLCEEEVPSDGNDQPPIVKDELIEWLQQHLPSTCTITRNKDDTYIRSRIYVKTILIWIR